jgi:hypothetical protein
MQKNCQNLPIPLQCLMTERLVLQLQCMFFQTYFAQTLGSIHSDHREMMILVALPSVDKYLPV